MEKINLTSDGLKKPMLNDTFLNDIKSIITEGLQAASRKIHSIIIETYWKIGRRIVEEEQHGESRSNYGSRLFEELSDSLTSEFGKTYSPRYLRAFRQFYLLIPNLEIWKSRFPNLTWTHIFRTLRVNDDIAARWYLQNASDQMWSVRTLDRNISTQYFERHFVAPSIVTKEENPDDTTETILKNPVVAEFLGLERRRDLAETELETAIINHLQDFIMEMGKGFAFVKRQQLIRTCDEDYYIDLVFYNINLKCYVLIDLKTGKITHQDVGQMDMYVRMYDDLKLSQGDNPTIGIILCSQTDPAIAKYSILHDNNRLFASEYMLYLPKPEDLAKEIAKQKEIFLMQHPGKP